MQYVLVLTALCAASGPLLASTQDTQGCSPCFTLVEEAVSEHRSLLDQLEDLLKRVRSGPAPAEDRIFETQLTLMSAYIQDLFNDARRAMLPESSSLELLGDLQERVEEIKKVAGSIISFIEKARPNAEDSASIISEVEQIVQRIETSLRKTLLFLQNEGADALRRTVEQNKQFGLQSARMSQIAREARQHADRHDTEAQRLETLSNAAVSNATAAYQLAYRLVQGQRDFSAQMTGLDASLVSAETLLVQTRGQAAQAHTEAHRAYRSAFSVYTEAKDGVRAVDVDSLRRRASYLKEQAQRLKAELEALTSEHGPLLELVDKDITRTRTLIQAYRRHQADADQLLIDVTVAMDKAAAAVNTGEATLEEAQKTLQTLLRFDAQVQDSREEAEQALLQVQVIVRLVEEAERKTSDGSTALQGADRNANSARDSASEAEIVAEQAMEQVLSIRSESSATKSRAASLRQQATRLHSEVAQVSITIERYEEQIITDSALSREALERANKAKSSAADASAQVDAAHKQVRQILAALAAAGDVGLVGLDALEERLLAAEAALSDAQLELRLEELRSSRTQINQMARDFSRDVAALLLEVDNIQEIAHVLPDGCFSRVKLEP